MPELPEVQTIVNDLSKKIKGKTILGVLYCDAPSLIRNMIFKDFEKQIKGRLVKKIERRAKNILIYLDKDEILAIHLKMTGHLLVISNSKFLISNSGVPSGRYLNIIKGKWVGESLPTELQDPKNQFIHLVFELSDGLIMAYSDLRKFGEIRIVKRDYLSSLESKLGPEPLDPKFDLSSFEAILGRSKGKIKAVLMDQNRISGIGNIYADEILFDAGVLPWKMVGELSRDEIKKIFNSVRRILKKGVELRGTSDSDYRDTSGKEGGFQKALKVYRRTGKKCHKCGGVIERVKIGQRSAHYCGECQK